MAKGGFLEHLKNIIGDLVDTNGNFRVLPIGRTGKLNLSNNKIKLLTDTIKLLRDTSIITRETKLYVFDKHITISGVNELINFDIGKDGKEVSRNSTQSKIQYDKIRLQRFFGVDFFVNILTRDIDISVYEKTLAELFVKYSGKDGARDNLLLKIPKDCMNTSLTEEEFEEFRQIISPYIKSHINKIEESIDIRYCGYFNYLLNMPNLDGINKERADILTELLSN